MFQDWLVKNFGDVCAEVEVCEEDLFLHHGRKRVIG